MGFMINGPPPVSDDVLSKSVSGPMKEMPGQRKSSASNSVCQASWTKVDLVLRLMIRRQIVSAGGDVKRICLEVSREGPDKTSRLKMALSRKRTTFSFVAGGFIAYVV